MKFKNYFFLKNNWENLEMPHTMPQAVWKILCLNKNYIVIFVPEKIRKVKIQNFPK